jgi:hypothetical protein
VDCPDHAACLRQLQAALQACVDKGKGRG